MTMPIEAEAVDAPQDGTAELGAAINREDTAARTEQGRTPERNAKGEFQNKTQTEAASKEAAAKADQVHMAKLAKDMPEIFGNLLEEDPDEILTGKHDELPPVKTDESPKEVPPDKPKETSAARKDALKVLVLDGWDEADLSGLSDSRLTAMSEKRKSTQREVNKRMDELATLKKGTAAADSKRTPAQDQDGSKAETDDALDGAVKGFEEIFGQEASEPLSKAFKAQEERHSKRIDALTSTLTRMAVNEARRELTSVYPDLADNEAFKLVEAKAEQISSGYTDIQTCMSDAAGLVFGKSDRGEALRNARQNGSMKVPTRKSQPGADKDAASFAAFKAIIANKPFDEVIRTRNQALNM